MNWNYNLRSSKDLTRALQKKILEAFSYVKDCAKKIETSRLLIDGLVYNFLALKFEDWNKLKSKWEYDPDILPVRFHCKHLRINGNCNQGNGTDEIREVEHFFESENEKFRNKICPLPAGILSLYLEVPDFKSKHFSDQWLLRLFTTG